MKGYVKRDDDGKIVIDNNGFITIACEDESVVFQLHLSEIDEKAEQMCFNINGKDVYLDVYPGWETTENDSLLEPENENEDKYQVSTPSTSKNRNTVFPWCDASTKIFLKEYKLKKELVKNHKLKNMKVAYQEISKNLQEASFNVSPLQVENRFKTLKRAYKNMLMSNKRTGRGRYICSYEQDLGEIFTTKHLLEMQETELNGEAEATGSGFSQDSKTKLNNFVRNFEGNNEHFARLEAHHTKIIEGMQSNMRILKSLATKMESRTKGLYDMQGKMLQVYMEMRDMQRKEYACAEEHRQKTIEQREQTNSLLREMLKILTVKKDK